jgi:hypothetical protein
MAAVVRAGQASVGFWLLSCTFVFQSASVPGLTFFKSPNIAEPCSLYVTLNEILQIFKHLRLCRHDPTLFLAHCKAHKTLTQSQPCKELKMPTHSPPTPADQHLSSFGRHFSNISLLDTKAHPPHNQQTLNNLALTIAANRF